MFKTLITAFIAIGLELVISCRYSEDNKNFTQAGNYNIHTPDTCDNPDGDINCCFVNISFPLTSVMKIGDENEPGEKIILRGKIIDAETKQPVKEAILYSFHTDHKGKHSKNGNESGIQKWHGRLYGWCETDSTGYFEIHTIKPAPEPSNIFPAHIHTAIRLNTGKTFWLNDFLFSDDSLITESYLESIKNPNNPKELDNGVVTLTNTSNGKKEGERNIYLIK